MTAPKISKIKMTVKHEPNYTETQKLMALLHMKTNNLSHFPLYFDKLRPSVDKSLRSLFQIFGKTFSVQIHFDNILHMIVLSLYLLPSLFIYHTKIIEDFDRLMNC